MIKEIWKPIFRGFYAASNLGRIKRLKRHRAFVGDGILRPTVTRNGYELVTLSAHGRLYYRLVHRLVALAFLGTPGTRQVNHKNGVKRDNRSNNLEYVSQSENMLHAVKCGLLIPQDFKLTKAQRAFVKKNYRPGRPWHPGNSEELAKKFKVHEATIRRSAGLS